MSKIGPFRSSRLRKTLAAIRDLANTLPSAQEKAEIERDLQQILQYLSEAKASLTTIPAREEVNDLLVAANRLDKLFEMAEANPAVARALGLQRTVPRKPVQGGHEIPSKDTQRLMDLLSGLKPDQARSLLLDPDRYSLSQIKAAAQGYGIRVQSRWTRETIAGKIVSHLANVRGYRLLREDIETP